MGALPAETKMGAVHLTVADLERSLRYYRDAIGLNVLERGSGQASLGTDGSQLLALYEVPGSQPAPSNTGLFHFALLVPERRDLARWLAHAVRTEVALTGASDHFVSEAIYLRDPDLHGIEIYADRPRDVWEGQVARMTTAPLDIDGLLGEANGEAFASLPAGTTMGHVHLQVADIPDTIGFYRDVLGFDLTVTIPSAAFLSAGGYHHHVGGNTWASGGAPPPPDGAAALRLATIVLPTRDDRAEAVKRVADAGGDVVDSPDGPVVSDPSGNSLLLA